MLSTTVTLHYLFSIAENERICKPVITLQLSLSIQGGVAAGPRHGYQNPKMLQSHNQPSVSVGVEHVDS